MYSCSSAFLFPNRVAEIFAKLNFPLPVPSTIAAMSQVDKPSAEKEEDTIDILKQLSV